jgi:hypothetical protein
VSRPVDGLEPAWWPPRRSRSSELEERPGHGPNPRFLCPSARSPVASPESNQRRLTRETATQQMCKSAVSIRVVAAFARYLPGLSLIRFL